MEIIFLQSVIPQQLLSTYEFFVMDVWGVLIDGWKILPGALSVLKELYHHHKTVILLTNTPELPGHLIKKLNALGISESYYQGIVTAGGVAREFLTRDIGYKTKKNYFYIGPDSTAALLEGTAFKKVDELSEADFILANGFPEKKLDLSLLKKSSLLNVPLVCSNPDLYITDLSGKKFACAGSLAKQYESHGGKVFYIGKPYPMIYDYLFSQWHLNKEKVLVVGDMVETDIKGAKLYGLDSLLVNKAYLGDNSLKPNYVIEKFTL